MPIRRKAAKASSGRTDWGRIDRMTEAEIERMAASDKEKPATSKQTGQPRRSACPR